MTATATSTRPKDVEAQRRIAGRYVRFEQLGAGGMGTVHRARDEATGRFVAFKQLVSSLAGGRRRMAEALFEREYHTLVRLKHPRIIEVYDYGLTETGPYYTMELLDGRDMNELGVMPYRDVCRILRDVASSLALIHARRLVHRDVSPRNIRLTQDGLAKLIDFGALAPFGEPEDIVGTPLCMAPEVVRKMPLDQRTDLYALGTVAYWALTGRHAYGVRYLQDLATAWETPPIPPSDLVPEIPRPLEALVLSLLNLDPVGRPPNAAAVIDQLTAIGGLAPEEHEQAAESYLSSSRMVGRTTEMQLIERRVERSLRGQGAAIVIEGSAGVGRTRLLREASLDAQLKGAVTLQVDAQATSEPFGVAASLGVGLLDACPDVARKAAGEHAALLARLSPLLRDKLGEVGSVELSADAGERRARFQTALHEWVLGVATERTLFLAVDNVQAADENSAAFLAALSREARHAHLVLVVTQRTGDSVVAAAPVRMLHQDASRLKLGGLNAATCEDLVKSLFGNVPNTGRIAKLLFERSAGVPQQCLDLARLLVRKKIAQYETGTWVLPQDVAADEVPSQAEEILASRLAGLSATARELVETLGIHSIAVSLEQCVALAEGRAQSETFAALDELVAEQILRTEAGSYRFSHSALREAVLSRMDETRRRSLHRRAADALLEADPSGVSARIEAALHLLDAGEDSRGAMIMSKLGWGLASAQDLNAGGDAALALFRAFEVFERQGRSEHELGSLLFPMMKLAYYSAHWRLILKYGERALEIGLRITGLSLAEKLRPFLGRRLALVSGLVAGGIGFSRQKRRGLEYDLKTAIVACCGILPAVVGTSSTCLDVDRVARIKRIVRPLTLFGAKHVAGLLYEWAPTQLLATEGREGEARVAIAQTIDRNRAPAIRQALGEANWKSQYGGLLFMRGLFDAYAFGDAALRGAEELESLGIRVWTMAADQIRMLYHAFRGELDAVQRYREHVELFAVQGSTTWQAEMFWPALLLNADVLTADVIAARRTSEQLARRSKDVQSLERYANAAHAAYLTLRGEFEAAVALYEKILPEFPLRQNFAYETTRAYFAQALNLAGQHARAKEVAEQVLSGMVEADQPIAVHFLESHRQLALAEAGLGNYGAAIRILDSQLEKHGGEDNPLLVGLLHKARAEVALLAKDREKFEHHLREMVGRFRVTRNAALLAQCEQLVDRAKRGGILQFAALPGQVDAALSYKFGSLTIRTLGELSAAADPCEYALLLLLEQVKAKRGYLYLYRKNAMQLVAASGPGEAPRQLETALQRLAAEVPSDDTTAEAAADESESGDETVAVAMDEAPSRDGTHEVRAVSSDADDASEAGISRFVDAYQLRLLDIVREGARVVVGGLIVETGLQDIGELDLDFLRSVSGVLFRSASHDDRADTGAR